MADDNQAARLARRRDVAKLMLAGHSWADIAQKLGVSRQQARKDALAITREYKAEIGSTAEILRTREIATLSDYIRRLEGMFTKYEAEDKGEMAARVFDRIRGAIELRSELEGLRRPQDDVVAKPQMNVFIGAHESEGPNRATAPVGADRKADNRSGDTKRPALPPSPV